VQYSISGIRLSDHLDAADGETVFQHACAMGLEGIVAKRRDSALSLWALARLDQGQEPGRSGSNQGDRGLIAAVPVLA